MQRVEVSHRIAPVDIVLHKEKAKKSKRWFWKLNRFIAKSVNYYADEEFRKAGYPLRWID